MTNWKDIHQNFTPELQKKWEAKGFTAEETKEWIEFGLKPEEADFADWLKKKYNITAEEFLGDDDMEELRSRYKKELEEASEESKEEEKQNAQDWLNQKYPKEERENIKELYINEENLEGDLKIEGFANLENLYCYNNKLTDINISKCPKLKSLRCYNNKLSELDLRKNDQLEEINCSDNQLEEIKFEKLPNLVSLDIRNNNFAKNDLSFFEKFTKLEELYLGNNDGKKIKAGNYNKFYGSLKPLGKLDWLKKIDISNTDIDSGLDYLMENDIEEIYCSAEERDTSSLSEIIKELKKESSEFSLSNGKYVRKNNFAFDPLSEKLKRKDAQSWLDEEYPKNGACRGVFSLEDKGKERKDVEELDISGEELKGILSLDGFDSLKYLACRNNQLTEIDLRACSKLEGVDCRNNKLKSLLLSAGMKLKEFNGSNNEFTGIESICNSMNPESLTFFDISDNKISDSCRIDIFNKFLKLKSLYIGNEKGEGNEFKGSVQDLKNLKELFDIDITCTKIKIGNFNELPEKLEEIYCNKNESISEQESEEMLKDLESYYIGRDKFYDVRAWRDGKPRDIKINKIVKVPLLSENKSRHDISRIEENYDFKKVKYDEENGAVYPLETNFEWKTSGSSSLSKLPLRLCCISNESDESGEPKIEIKTRINCADKAKSYAILSYSWGGKADESIKWSLKNAQERLSLGGQKALKKAIKTLKVLKNKHNLDIKYFWMDQLCIDQNNPKEKGHEVTRMREYYGNGTVTLIPINTNIGEETIRKLIRSFEPGESGLIYPNKIIENSLPILEKIIGSEWFSRSWTFQEGLLSKQTIFMFDDYLIDGRFMALIWKLRQVSEVHYDECKRIKELCEEKSATPVGWTYFKEGYNSSEEVSLRLNEALRAIRDRKRSVVVDGIYSIIGLLTYGERIRVDYGKDPESVLREVMLVAVKNGYGEPLSWHGVSSRTPGLCWLPEINAISGETSITGVINIDYQLKKGKFSFKQNRGIKILASEYVICDVEKSSGIYNLDREGIVDGNLWMRKVWIGSENSKREKLTLSGTKEGMKAAGKGRVLIIPNKEIWKSDEPFAILALGVRNNYNGSQKYESQVNTHHRLDLVRIEEGWESINSSGEEKFIIGLDNQFQAQIEINPYQ